MDVSAGKVSYSNKFRESSNEDIVEIESLPNERDPSCADSALVHAVPTDQPSSSTVWIYARDRQTGKILKTEVKTNKIHRLLIELPFVKVNVGSTDDVVVKAQDSLGETISAVDGLQFKWEILPNEDTLRLENNVDSSGRTDLALITGLKTGRVTLRVTLVGEGFQNVAPAEVELNVVQQFVLLPQRTVRILPNSEFKFDVARIKDHPDFQHQYTPVTLPSSEFAFSLDSEAGSVDNSAMVTSHDKLTTLTIRATDQTIDDNIQEGKVVVVAPESLSIECEDVTKEIGEQGVDEFSSIHLDVVDEDARGSVDRNWVMVEGRYYYLKQFLFDEQLRKIQLTKNLLFGLSMDTDYIEVVNVNSENSRILVKAKKTGNIKLTGFLEEVQRRSESHFNFDLSKLKDEKDVEITSQVKITSIPRIIRLPWLGYRAGAPAQQMWTLNSIGGTGAYHWSSFNETVVGTYAARDLTEFTTKVSEIRGVQKGKTIVKVQDQRNSLNFDTIEVEVEEVGSLTWLEPQIESELGGKTGYAALIAYDINRNKFTNCSSLILGFEAEEESDIINFDTTGETWRRVKQFAEENTELLKLRKRFDSELVHFESELSEEADFSEEWDLHNSFGLCKTFRYRTRQEGLFAAKPVIPELSSLYADSLKIASYRNPENTQPAFPLFFNDVKNQRDSNQLPDLFSHIRNNDFSIAYGSGLQWTFIGGTNYWADNDFSRVQNIYGAGDYEFQLSQTREFTSQSNQAFYFAECLNYNQNEQKEVSVSIDMSNQVSINLLRPKKTTATLAIRCAIPKRTELYWAKHSQASKSQDFFWPHFSLIQNERVYDLANNQTRFVRALVFDSEDKLIMNTTSLNYVFSSDNTKFIEMGDDVSNDRSAASLQFQKGETKLRVKLNSYTDGNTFPEITDSLRVNLVAQVKIEPSFQTRYLHPENSAIYHVIDGSSEVRVASAPLDPAGQSFDQAHREISMSPQAEGIVTITAEDQRIPEHFPAEAQLFVSDIARLELFGEGKIEEGAAVNLTLKAFDSQGIEFSPDQMRFMKLMPSFQRTGEELQNAIEITQIGDDIFNVLGLKAGFYGVTVSSLKYNSNKLVSSNIANVHVFPYVSVVPQDILIYPGGRWTVQINGGPDDAVTKAWLKKEFTIENTEIAEVDSEGEILGKTIGDTSLTMVMTYTSGKEVKLLASRSATVRVRFVTSVEINQMNERSVFVKSFTRLNTRLLHNDEVFLPCIGPVSYDWRTSSSGIYQLLLPNSESSQNHMPRYQLEDLGSVQHIWNQKENTFSPFETSFNFSSISGEAHKHGEVTLDVQMAIEYPEIYMSQRNWFDARVKLIVSEQIHSSIKMFKYDTTNQTKLHILPPRASYQVSTNKDRKMNLFYEMDSNSNEAPKQLIKLDDQGRVITGDIFGHTMVTIEEQRSGEDQTEFAIVAVKQIYSVAVLNPYQVLSIPKGNEISLDVAYQEDHGRRFAENIEGISVEIDNSHPQFVSTSLDTYNQTLTISAKNIGEAHIRIRYSNRTFDVVRVRVASSIKPHSPVSVAPGAKIWFSYDKGSADQRPRWGVVDSNVLSISHQGEASAVSVGETTVTYKGEIDLDAKVHVRGISHVDVDPNTLPSVFTNVKQNEFYNEEHKVRLNVFLDSGLDPIHPKVYDDDGRVLVDSGIKIGCSVAEYQIAQAHPRIIDNEFYCVIRPEENDSSYHPQNVTVSVTAHDGSGKRVDQSFPIGFIGKMSIEPNHRVQLFGDSREQVLQVVSNAPFKVEHNSGSRVRTNYEKKEGEENLYSLTISVPESLSSEFENQEVRIVDQRTNQVEYLSVSFLLKNKEDTPAEPERPKPTPSNPTVNPKEKSGSKIMLFLMIIICIVFMATFFLCCSDRTEDSPPSAEKRAYKYKRPDHSANHGRRF